MRWTLTAFALSILACDANTPTNPTPASPSLSEVAAGHRCYGVQFNARAVRTGIGILEGDVTGDLEGTVLYHAIPGSANGKAIQSGGRNEFTITGGIVPELISGTFAGDYENVSVRVPGELGVFRTQGTTVIDEGARDGHLTLHGVIDFPAGFAVDFDYSGQICP